jgi:excisionase family DNA binding protein
MTKPRITRRASEPRPLFTVKGAAKHLAISERTIERCIARGEIPVVRVGSQLRRIRPEDLDRYIADRRK